MNNKNHNERIKTATDKHTELMELTFRMHMTEQVNFNKVMELLREVYKDQLMLINMLHTYEKENEIRIKLDDSQLEELRKVGVL